MGGLTALLLANQQPGRVLSFVDIKGNLAPEDCFLSRQIFDFPSENPETFLDAFITRTRQAKSFASPLYASTLRARVKADVVRPIFESMVQLSDNEDHYLLPSGRISVCGLNEANVQYVAHAIGQVVKTHTSK